MPEGLTLEQLDKLAIELERKRRRDYYKRNPEKMLNQRINTAINLLRRNGYTVSRKDGANEQV